MSDIAEYIETARFSDRETYLAMLNVLDDFGEDRSRVTAFNEAIINILEDFDEEKKLLTHTNRAVINILEDLDESRANTESLNLLLEKRVTKRTTELAQSEELFRLLIEGVKDYALIVLDPSGNVAAWNPGAERINGYTSEEIIGQHFSRFYREKDCLRGKPQKELETALKEGYVEDEGWRVRKDGSKFFADIVITALYDEEGHLRGFGKVTRDITERKAAEQRAREAMRQEVLLKEIHHRVKNNLQVISSLLFLQSTTVKDEKTLEILLESQGRVKSIALIHEKLYRSDNLEKLDFGDYTRDLLSEMVRTYSIDSNSINVHLEVDNILLGIDTSIPCGLIINELVSNAMKHAFPGDNKGDVWIKIYQDDADMYVIHIYDNGIGLVNDHDWRKSNSLGLKLVVDLTKQLSGELIVSGKGGTSFKIIFNEMIYKKRQ